MTLAITRARAGGIGRLRRFVRDIAGALAPGVDEADILKVGAGLLADLVARDDWLPAGFDTPTAAGYAQRLLYCDAQEQFSVVSYAWGPGHETPIHDHTVWGLVGVLRGAESEQAYALTGGAPRAAGPPRRLEAGSVATLSPRIGDIHRVRNALSDAVSVSIHLYGANIGTVERSRFDAQGAQRRFISGYDNAWTPNLWTPT